MKTLISDLCYSIILLIIGFCGGYMIANEKAPRNTGIWVQYTYDDLLGWHIESIQNDYAGGLIFSNAFPKKIVKSTPPHKFNQ